MKKILVIAIATLITSCNGLIGNGYTIVGEVKGLADGTNVYLEKQDETRGIVAVDTVKVENGTFTFKGEAQEPKLHSIRFENKPGGFVLVLEKGTIQTVINKDSIANAKISGTYNNDELVNYNKEMLKTQNKMIAFEQQFTNVLKEAKQKNDTVTINKLQKEYAKFNDEFILKSHQYVETHPKSFLSTLLLNDMFNELMPNTEQIQKYYNALDKNLKTTEIGKKIEEKIKSIKKVSVGQIAPDFSAKTPEGKLVSLQQSLGKITIIDFWASWCGPCRQENPKLVALYKKYHNQGLNIVSVSLDKEGAQAVWKEAIAKDNLSWTQLSNLKHWEDPIALQYNIQSIPATFIVDANRKIIAKDLTGTELKNKIEQLFAK